MPRNVVVLLDNPDGRAMVKKSCSDNGLIYAELYDAIDGILDRIETAAGHSSLQRDRKHSQQGQCVVVQGHGGLSNG